MYTGNWAEKIGIFGGTFDPIHHGHLICAEAIRTEFDLDKIVFIPCKSTATKETGSIAPAEDRYVMTKLAVMRRRHFEVSRIELDRPGPSYTATTAMQLHELYPESALHLIIGMDAFAGIKNWRESEKLMDLVSLIVMGRPGHGPATTGGHCPYNVSYAKNPLISISSTHIRERLYHGRSISHLVPGPVVDYIRGNGLYRGTCPAASTIHNDRRSGQ
ncbi:MAG TPA: nicotinate-nucleotide adenylyltransferase [Spirochaetota bacterium]|nr:nicotinate-nucleotide adenylyltransferase [Spirochaetota bacterium]HPC42535.1 nicotinate-nucleotide adenylyltransferase [Spirochaetota bacterium]HPL15489.1 nicotinate-nucleotide adenylyltransferase [Spirochaetota bacterium]HQF10177.1 nicotinate-nucleotide adenylyltransferase [Spirochaetota bacterium]HQH98961.1 nicotinate-nucleotide adenylyltransferase [Spirochaetota bacterium]